jgi:glycosyltransferase involved in cell wall biosynthesis
MGTGGAESVVCDLAADAAGHGDDVALVAAPGPLDARLEGVTLRRLPLPAPGREPVRTTRAALALRRALRELRPELIHAHNPRVTAAVRLARRLAGMPAVPILATFHAGAPERDRAAARVLAGVERVACVSVAVRDDLVEEGLDPGRVVVVRNGTAAAREPPPERREALKSELGLSDGPVIVAVGRLAPEKAHSRYLDAIALAAPELPDARFLLVGDGPLRAALERQARELGLAGRLLLTGSRPDARDLIAISDLLVLPSDREGLPVVALEGLAAGVPLLSTALPGVDELVRAGAARVVPADAEALAGELVALMRDPGGRAEMGARARELHADEFSMERMVEEYRRLYADLLAGPT